MIHLSSRRLRRPGWPARLLLVAAAIAVGGATIGRLAPNQVPAVIGGLGAADVGAIGGASGGADVARPDTAATPAGGASLSDPDGRLPLDRRIAFWADRVAAHPDDLLSLVQLALVHAERGRRTVDLEAYDQALGVLDRALEQAPAYLPAIRARAQVRFTLHDFAGARADAGTVLADLPNDAVALAVLGDTAAETGDPAAAADAYDRLEAVAPGPWLLVRRARAAYLAGDATGALSLARRARADAATADPGESAFYAYAVGEYARLAGDAVTARQAFETALRLRPDDVAILVGLARIDAFDGRTADAIAGLRRATGIAPQPETLALLGNLHAASGDIAAADDAYATIRFIEQLGERASAVYDRELIRFELEHAGDPATSLVAAQRALGDRPDAAGHDLLGWALHRLGRDAEAAIEMAAALQGGIVDARILAHAGIVDLAVGDEARCIERLRAALALGPALDPAARAEARAALDAAEPA